MRNELFQMCCYVSVLRQILEFNKDINFEDNTQYIDRITFKFIPRENFFHKYEIVAHDFNEWKKCLKKEGLIDIKLFTPIGEAFKTHLASINTHNSFITCLYKNGMVTTFTPYWSFNSESNKWNVVYTENKWENPPFDFFEFKDNTEDFIKIINNCIEFSKKTNLTEFVNIFQKCLDILDDKDCSLERKNGLTMPKISNDKLKLFEAASNADVFGGMGSWNDVVFNGSLGDEYQKLSDELFKQYKLAILYTVNE